jgi:sulfatase maturation enzyme AslB (radical SAM superfamily)
VLELLAPLAADFSQSPLVQGALFHLHGQREPQNPKYRLEGKLCRAPFMQLDVLESSAHLCCASWLRESVGNVASGNWQGVWNSPSAEAIRASIHDGSYRYCNKGACPSIQGNQLVPAEQLRTEDRFWQQVVDERMTTVQRGPQHVNLAYDRTCNLACPSCRVERFAADDRLRARFEMIQETAILPMLKSARIVFITGSGDPFASKNFRQLMEQLTPEEYPELRFQVMTNGMLLTPRQWERFPALHGRVQFLRISIDAATGPTHELLRRGARWPVMLENLAFAGELRRQRLVDRFELAFTVQQENYREMGDAVDLAHRMGACGVHFGRITNWGTFTATRYEEKAVFLPNHPEYRDFVVAMQDPRLRDPIVELGDLADFAASAAAAAA